MAMSSSGQDSGLSSRERGFDSRRRYQFCGISIAAVQNVANVRAWVQFPYLAPILGRDGEGKPADKDAPLPLQREWSRTSLKYFALLMEWQTCGIQNPMP
jgi:hypothetical protein